MNEYIIMLVAGITMAVVAIGLYLKHKSIKNNGITTEGIVYDLAHDENSSNNSRYPIIRFVTRTKVWITEKADIAMFPVFYKKGQKVIVIYDDKDPKRFIINSKSNNIIHVVFGILSFILILFAVYKLTVNSA